MPASEHVDQSASTTSIRHDILFQLDAISHGRWLGGASLTSSQHPSAAPSASVPANSRHFSNPPNSPTYRRLPPLFLEQRQHTNAARRLCAAMDDTLHLLDEDFARGQTSPSAKPPVPLLLLRAERRAVPRDAKDGETPEISLRAEDVARARVAAADEGLSDVQSVADYSAEPDVPRFAPDVALRAEVTAMDSSLRRIVEVAARMAEIDGKDSGNPWWQSAMLTRDMKAHAIRVNYHARHVLQWNYRAREHFLVEAVATNEQSEKCRADIIYLREQQGLFVQRIESCQKAQEEAAAEMAKVQDVLREARRVRGDMQKELLDAAHTKGLLPWGIKDSVKAEFLLLMELVTWPPALMQDVERVTTWIREKQFTIDV